MNSNNNHIQNKATKKPTIKQSITMQQKKKNTFSKFLEGQTVPVELMFFFFLNIYIYKLYNYTITT